MFGSMTLLTFFLLKIEIGILRTNVECQSSIYMLMQSLKDSSFQNLPPGGGLDAKYDLLFKQFLFFINGQVLLTIGTFLLFYNANLCSISILERIIIQWILYLCPSPLCMDIEHDMVGQLCRPLLGTSSVSSFPLHFVIICGCRYSNSNSSISIQFN